MNGVNVVKWGKRGQTGALRGLGTLGIKGQKGESSSIVLNQKLINFIKNVVLEMKSSGEI